MNGENQAEQQPMSQVPISQTPPSRGPVIGIVIIALIIILGGIYLLLSRQTETAPPPTPPIEELLESPAGREGGPIIEPEELLEEVPEEGMNEGGEAEEAEEE